MSRQMSEPRSGFDPERYYRKNSRLFRSLGVGRDTGAIHRPVYLEDSWTKKQALEGVHELLLGQVERLGGTDTVTAIDLGCGFGSSLLRLGREGLTLGLGVVADTHQAQQAKQRLKAADLPFEILVGDFCDSALKGRLQSRAPQCDLIYMIEALTHARDARAVFELARAMLRPGGCFVVCDDVVRDPAPRGSSKPKQGLASEAMTRNLNRFRVGWQLPALSQARELRRLARRCGLEIAEDLDLTPHLRLKTPRDLLVQAAVRLLRPVLGDPQTTEQAARAPSYWLNLNGGHALQQLLLHGQVQYRFFVFRRP